MTDYRDPKVTTPKSGGSNTGKWLAIALAVLLLLLLAWWLWPSEENEVNVVPVVPGETTTAPAVEPVTPAR